MSEANDSEKARITVKIKKLLGVMKAINDAWFFRLREIIQLYFALCNNCKKSGHLAKNCDQEIKQRWYENARHHYLECHNGDDKFY